MADITKITLPSGTTYNIADAQARADILELMTQLTGAMHYIGQTTTALSDGATTKQIVIGTTTYYVGPEPSSSDKKLLQSGDVVIYSQKEYVALVSGTGTSATIVWSEFGSTGSLKALAFKDTAAGSTNFTPHGSVSKPTFTGTQKQVSCSYTPAGSVTVGVGAGAANYTPSGSVSKPGITVTPQTDDVYSIEGVGTLPACTLPQFTATVQNETLTLGWTAGSFSQGTLPTRSAKKTLMKSATAALNANPTFTGAGVELTGSFSGTPGTATGNFKPEGSVSQPSFTGTQDSINITVS